MRRGLLAAALVVAALGLTAGASAEVATITIAMRPNGAGGTQNSGQDAIQKIAEAYMKDHPDVVIKYQPLTGDWQTKLTAEMIAGTAPDISEGWGGFAKDWAERGLLVDLRPFVKTDFSQADIKDFYPGQWGALVLYAGPLAGLRFGIPHYTNSEVMYFNKDLFDAAGLTYPDAAEKSGSWDWTTFRLDAKKMTVRDAAGKTTQWGFSPYRWPMWVYGAGGKIFNYPEDVTQFTLNQPAAVNGLKFLHDLMWVDQVAPSGGGAKVNMAGGKAGLADYWGSCCIGGLLQGINGTYHLGMANLPIGPTGERHAQVFNDMFVIAKNTKYPRVAWDVLKFMTSPEGARILSQYERLQPSRYSAIQTFAKLFPEVDAEVAAETAMSAYPSYDVVIPDPSHVTPVVDKAISDSVWNNTASIQTAVDAAAKQANAIIADYMKK